MDRSYHGLEELLLLVEPGPEETLLLPRVEEDVDLLAVLLEVLEDLVAELLDVPVVGDLLVEVLFGVDEQLALLVGVVVGQLLSLVVLLEQVAHLVLLLELLLDGELLELDLALLEEEDLHSGAISDDGGEGGAGGPDHADQVVSGGLEPEVGVAFEFDADLEDVCRLDLLSGVVLLLVPDDFVETHERALERLLECLLDLVVDLDEVLEPHVLDLGLLVVEGLVGLTEDLADVLDQGLQLEGDVLPILLLLFLELGQGVLLLLVDLDELLLGDLLALVEDLLGVGLEHLQLGL